MTKPIDFSSVSYDDLAAARSDTQPSGSGNLDRFMNMLGRAEGADYNTIVGGSKFDDFSKHPGIVGLRTKDGPSTAAGKYQITKSTYDDFAPKLGITDFSPASQDRIARAIIEKEGALDDINKGDFGSAIGKLGGRWASLPSSIYGQPKRSQEWINSQLGPDSRQELSNLAPSKETPQQEFSRSWQDLNGDAAIAAMNQEASSPMVANGADYLFQNPETSADDSILGTFKQGAKRGLLQSEGLMGGFGALVGKTGEEIFGKNFATDWMQTAGLDLYNRKMGPGGESEAVSKSASLTDVFDGKIPVTNWLADSAGYLAYQVAESIATGGVGAIVAKTVGKEAIAATAKPLVAREVVRLTAENAKKLVAKDTANLLTKDQIEKQAVVNAAQMVGAGATVFANNLRQEAGGIYPEALETADKDPSRQLDLTRVWASSLGAALVDTGAEIYMGKKLLKIGDGYNGGYAKRLFKEAGANSLVQGSTEGVQTGLERFGAKQDLTGDEAYRDYVDSIGVGALGGTFGAPVAAMNKAKQIAETPPPKVSDSPLTNAANTIIHENAKQAVESDPLSDVIAPIADRLKDRGFYDAIRNHPNLGKDALSDILGSYRIATNSNLEPSQREAAIARLNQFFELYDNQPNFTAGNPEARQTEVVPFEQQNTGVGPVDPRYGSIDGQATTVDQNGRPVLPGANQQIAGKEPSLLEYTEFQRRAKAEYESAYQDLVKAEQLGATIEERNQKQAALFEAEARLKQVTQAIEDNRKKGGAQSRDQLLEETIANLQPGQNINRAFDKALRRSGFTDTNFSEAERAKIIRFHELRQALEEDSQQVTSAPNEMDASTLGIKEKGQKQAAPSVGRKLEEVDSLMANGYVRQGDKLTHKETGHSVKLAPAQIARAKRNEEKSNANEQLLKRRKPIAEEQAAQAEPVADVAPEPAKAEEVAPPAAKIENVSSLQKDSSWVIRNKETGEVVMETFDRNKVDALNTDKYEAVPIQEYLGSINGQKKEQPAEKPVEEKKEAPKKSLDAIKRKYKAKSSNPEDVHKKDGKVDASPGSVFDDSQQLGIDSLLPYYLSEIKGVEDGIKVPNPKFVIGEVSEQTASEIARFIYKYEGKQRKLRVSGRTIKHVEEARPKIAQEIVENIVRYFVNPDEILPDHKAVGEKALLIHHGDVSTKLKHNVASVEVEIEIEVSDGFIDIVTIMTSPDRSLQKPRELKRNWQEGQQIPEQAGYSPHPIAAEAAHAEADLPNVQPVDSSVANDKSNGKDSVDAELDDALSKLGDILGDVFGAKLNITGQQYTARDLLPAMSKVIELLVKKGFKSFREAVGATTKAMRGNAATAPYVDQVSPRQWRAAYNSIAEFNEGTESEEIVAGISDAEVAKIIAGGEVKADDIYEKLRAAEAATDTNPTEAQKEAGNYSKGKLPWNGMTISIETPKGAERTGKDKDGNSWSVTMPAPYGYFLGTVGADKEHLDVFIGEDPNLDRVWVINQTQPGKSAFDEHKVVIGAVTASEAKDLYLNSFSGGFGDQVFGSIAGPFSVDEFKGLIPKLEKKAFLFDREVREPTEVAGFKVYPLSIKVGDTVEQRWAVQSVENKEREQKGERQLGGDTTHHLLNEAKRAAEQQARIAVEDAKWKAEIAAKEAAANAEEEARKEKNRGLTVAERKANAVLDKPTKLPVNAGVGRGSRREAMDSAIAQDRFITQVDVFDSAAYKKDEDEQQRLWRAGYSSFGNDQHPQKKRFDELTARLKDRSNYKKPEYRLYAGRNNEGGFYEITKTEYDYAQKLKGAPVEETYSAPEQNAVEKNNEQDKPFNSDAWNKERDDRIAASRAAGNTHLDKVPAYVETMRGKQIYNAHDPKERGVIRSVDNLGNVYINWADQYSADKNLASPSMEGKKQVFQTSLGPTDLKDYVLGDGKNATVNAESEQKPLATFEEGKTALRVIGDPAALKERLDPLGIKSVPRKDGVNIPNKAEWDRARANIPVSIEHKTIDGVPARLADVTVETMGDGSVSLKSPVEISSGKSAEELINRYREGYKDSPASVEPIVQRTKKQILERMRELREKELELLRRRTDEQNEFTTYAEESEAVQKEKAALGEEYKTAPGDEEESTGKSYEEQAMDLAREIMGDKFEATHKEINAFLAEARARKIPHDKTYFGDIPAYRRMAVDLVADENLKNASDEKLKKRIAKILGDVDASANKDADKMANQGVLGGSGAAGRQRDRARSSESREINRGIAKRLQLELERRESLPNAQESQPQHIENGKSEPATQAVIAQSVKKSADNTPLDLKKAKAWLLGEIDKAILAADGSGMVEFDVPGDGKFKIPNVKENLKGFREKVDKGVSIKLGSHSIKATPFAETRAPSKQTKAPHEKLGISASEGEIREMLKDGDYTAALEFSKQIGKPIVFGAGEVNPVVYTNASPFEVEGFEDFKMVTAREWLNMGGGGWVVLDLSSGLSVKSGGATLKDVERMARVALEKVTPEKMHAVVAESMSSGKGKTQEQLESDWVEWAEKKEIEDQKMRDAEHRKQLRNHKGVLSDYTGKPIEESGKPAAPENEDAPPRLDATGKLKDYGWAGAGLGPGGRHQKRRQIELEDGTDIEAVLSEHAGRYDEGYVRVNGIDVFRTNDSFDAQEQIDNLLQSRYLNKQEKESKGWPFESGGKWFNAEGTEELPKDWTGIAQAKSGTYFMLGQDGGERSFTALQAKSYPDAVKESEDKAKEADRAKYEAKVAEIKAKQEERARPKLSDITVTLKAKEAETGRSVEYDEKADVALADIDERMNLARSLLQCLAS